MLMTTTRITASGERHVSLAAWPMTCTAARNVTPGGREEEDPDQERTKGRRLGSHLCQSPPWRGARVGPGRRRATSVPATKSRRPSPNLKP